MTTIQMQEHWWLQIQPTPLVFQDREIHTLINDHQELHKQVGVLIGLLHHLMLVMLLFIMLIMSQTQMVLFRAIKFMLPNKL